MSEIFKYLFLITVNLLNISLHGLGSVLLYQMYEGAYRISQHLYILHLSISELLKNVAAIVVFIVKISGNSLSILLLDCLAMVMILFDLSMFFLTVDRLLQATVGDWYTQRWTTNKATLLILSTWIAYNSPCYHVCRFKNFTRVYLTYRCLRLGNIQCDQFYWCYHILLRDIYTIIQVHT